MSMGPRVPVSCARAPSVRRLSSSASCPSMVVSSGPLKGLISAEPSSKLRKKLLRATSDARTLVLETKRAILAAQPLRTPTGDLKDPPRTEAVKKKLTLRERKSERVTANFLAAVSEAEKLLGKKAMGALVEQYNGPYEVPYVAAEEVVIESEEEKVVALERRIALLAATKDTLDRCTVVAAEAKDRKIAQQDRCIFMLKAGLELVRDCARTARVEACERAVSFAEKRLAMPTTPSFIKMLHRYPIVDNTLDDEAKRSLNRVDALMDKVNSNKNRGSRSYSNL